jgi:hypothetical protein
MFFPLDLSAELEDIRNDLERLRPSNHDGHDIKRDLIGRLSKVKEAVQKIEAVTQLRGRTWDEPIDRWIDKALKNATEARWRGR